MWVLDLRPLLFVLLAGLLLGGWLLAAGITLLRTRRHASTPHLTDTLAHAPVGLLLLEGERIRYANHAARQLLHLGSDGTLLPDTDWRPLLQEDRVAARASDALAGRYRHVTFASGRTVRWWLSPTAGTTEDILVLQDVTAQQRSEQAARALVNDLGHELRTPVATLLTHLEILGLDDVGVEARSKSLALARSEAQRLARLINDMLELGRLETAQTLPRRPLELAALAQEVILQSMPRATAQKITLTLEASDGLPPVAGNADRLRQVFLNLLDNAFKYAGAQAQVTVYLQATAPSPGASKGAGVRCGVCDTGPGVAAGQLPYLTRRFYRAAPPDVEGSGLGLALVAEILRQHGSELQVESPGPGEYGFCAWFTLS